MGIFSQTKEGLELFTLYAARIEFRNRVLGGIPKSPELVEAWLRSKAGIKDTEELRHAWLRTLYEMGVEDIREDMSFEEAIEASKKIAGSKATTGFKIDPREGLYIESRQVKALLRENVNILYAGQRVGPTKKGPKAYAAERVFFEPRCLYLGAPEPQGIELMIGHVTGPQGPRSTLTYHEYVDRGAFDFTVMVTEDSIPADWWPRVWMLAENNGLGACRSQGFGTFDIVKWDKLGHPTTEQYERIVHQDSELLSERPLPGSAEFIGDYGNEPLAQQHVAPADTNGHTVRTQLPTPPRPRK